MVETSRQENVILWVHCGKIVTVRSAITPSVEIPITQQQRSDTIQVKAQFGPLTMIDARRSRRDVASEPLHDSLIFDASVRSQTNGSIYEVVAKQ